MSDAMAPLPASEERQGSGWVRVVGQIAAAIDKQLPPGDVAALRRSTPAEVGGPAFWKMAAAILEPAAVLPAGGAARDDAERLWGAIIGAAALLRGFHRPQRGLGSALATAGYSELRFVRLLRAHDDALMDAVRAAAQFLASRAEEVDCTDFARLLLTDGRDAEEAARRRIARAYYSNLDRKD